MTWTFVLRSLPVRRGVGLQAGAMTQHPQLKALGALGS